MQQNQISYIIEGFDTYKLQALQERDEFEAIALKYQTSSGLNILLTGSYKEGFPDLCCSDIDYMMVLNSQDSNISQDWQTNIFKEVPQCNAYLTLNMSNETVPSFIKTFSLSKHLLERGISYSYISAEKARIMNRENFLPEFHGNRLTSDYEGTSNRTGPAYTLQKESLAVIEVDRVSSLACAGWPAIAADWLTRPRTWPGQEVIDKIAHAGFHVVPKVWELNSEGGGETESSLSMHWRYSFSIAEAVLFNEFNEKQQKVYYLVRCIHGQYLKKNKIVKDVLTSYHVKTSMMWFSEKKDCYYWNNDICRIVQDYLKYLSQLIKKGKVFHFFIPSANLFPQKVNGDLLNKVGLIIENAFEEGYLTNGSHFGLMNRLHFLDFQEYCMQGPSTDPDRRMDALSICAVLKNNLFLMQSTMVTPLLKIYQPAITMGKDLNRYNDDHGIKTYPTMDVMACIFQLYYKVLFQNCKTACNTPRLLAFFSELLRFRTCPQTAGNTPRERNLNRMVALYHTTTDISPHKWIAWFEMVTQNPMLAESVEDNIERKLSILQRVSLIIGIFIGTTPGGAENMNYKLLADAVESNLVALGQSIVFPDAKEGQSLSGLFILAGGAALLKTYLDHLKANL